MNASSCQLINNHRFVCNECLVTRTAIFNFIVLSLVWLLGSAFYQTSVSFGIIINKED